MRLALSPIGGSEGSSGRSDELNYIENEELIAEILESQEKGRITDRLGELMMILVENIARKPEFSQLHFLDDLKGNALLALCRNVLKFDIARSRKAFDFATTLVINDFRQSKQSESAKHGSNVVPFDESTAETAPPDPSGKPKHEPVDPNDRRVIKFRKDEAEVRAESQGLSEEEIHRRLRERRMDRRRSGILRKRKVKEATTDKVLGKALELVDTHGVSKKDIEKAVGISKHVIREAILGNNRPQVREARMRALGLSAEQYVARCEYLTRSKAHRKKEGI